MASLQKPTGVHLVGSVPLSSTEEVFRTVSAELPGRLLTIPDGETGDRYYFVRWQKFAFPEAILRSHLREDRSATIGGKHLTTADVQPTKYDEFAIQSEGVLSSNTKFQVSIPTPPNVINSRIDPLYQVQVEPFYEERLLQALDGIQKHIPYNDLAIQVDCALEMAYMEYDRGRLNHPALSHISHQSRKASWNVFLALPQK